ncbi:hypothetical protein QF025_006718 [Paraburkholderia graminis]|uniref:Secreted protein n=1 Tax=Paraburkholderia graminis TaxID=60548 RepID=A0ABD5CRN3_9BURK|nr:hypothetical protein [Paraburkholderia graminis]
MFKRILLLAFLALPGSFVIVSLVCVHPRSRAMLAELAYSPQLLVFVKAHIARRLPFRTSQPARSCAEPGGGLNASIDFEQKDRLRTVGQ